MLLIRESKKLSGEINFLKQEGKKIVFVPTMGNLHKGHRSLFKKDKDYIYIASIFVNPLQFNNVKDFESYPRTIETDIKILNKQNVDILYLPCEDFLNERVNYNIGEISKKLCGKDRKGHFEGVAVVIINFLKLIKPDYILLGEKDYQQVLIIKKIIKDFNFKTEAKLFPTIRDKNDVALSSRNQLLKEKLFIASHLPIVLKQIIREIKKGGFDLIRINYFKKLLKSKGVEKVFYLEILKVNSLDKLDEKLALSRVFISVCINGVRLIDNMLIDRRIKLLEGRVYCE